METKGDSEVRLALFQPDIPQNLGAAVRLAACLGLGLDVIRPTAFPLGARELRRAAMDYAALIDPVLHDSWDSFLAVRPAGRLVLLTTAAETDVDDFAFAADDTLLLGRESAGAPAAVHAAADARLRIAMAPGARSLNVVTAAAFALGAAGRRLRG
nr:TrmH family RNA methyltransferase [Minwuia thermotolerans]